jgi:membrane-associated phospholipid phosphatase
MDLLSGLGDMAFVLPASATLIIVLVSIDARREAAVFVAALAVGMGLALLAKLAFAACGRVESIFDIESPSGHAALGATFYGCGAALLAGGRPPGQRLAIYLGAIVAALAIAYGRVALGVHSIGEVICGLLIGALATAVFAAFRGPPRRLWAPTSTLLRVSPIIVLLAVDLALFSDRWTAEPLIARFAALFGRSLNLCG